MSTYDEIAAQNRREAVLAMYAAMGCTPPSEVASPVVKVASPPPKVASLAASLGLKVASQLPPKPIVVASREPVPATGTKQQAWRSRNRDAYLAWRREYMRDYRKRSASARNAPVTASDATAPATTAET